MEENDYEKESSIIGDGGSDDCGACGLWQQ